ncbi:MAG TPA: response regulator [Bacteroidetes bacterium]|nr:response regulator [Bacteroidota bacterium]
MQNLKVFLVEDDEIYSMILAQKLKVFGNFFVSTFSTGESALEHLGLHKDIDVVILDYDLPGISGLETLQHIQKMNHEAKVLFLSGIDKAEIIQECMAAGAHEFIHKDKDVATKVYVAISRIVEDESKKKKKGFFGSLFGKLRGE